MNILKQTDSKLFLITNITEEWLIDQYNVAVNYKDYIGGLLKMDDKSLLSIAPGLTAKQVRKNLISQFNSCDEYLEAWQKIIDQASTKKEKQN